MRVSIRVKGYLDPSWGDWLDGLQILHEADHTSRIVGSLQDQPALYGLVSRIGRLSLTLLSLEAGDPTLDESQ
jgi:hypothetical protein